MTRKTGNVKWFSNEKGYGFIEQEDGEDVFVHHSDIEGDGYKTLKQGEMVEYEIIEADKGPKAQSVVRSDGADGNGSDASSESREAGGESSARNGGSSRSAPSAGSSSDGSERNEPQADSSLASQLRKKLTDRFLSGS